MKFFSRLLLCFLSFWFTASPLLAGPSDAARAAYGSGDFKKAGKLAAKAVKKSKSKTDKAEAYMIDGAAQVKLGKAGKGKSKFAKALKLDPNVSLPSEASGDAKVEKAFASAQKKAGTKVSDGGSSASTDRITKTGSAGAKSATNFKNYIPFGVNNYMQGKVLTAAVTGGAQATGFFLYLYNSQGIATANSKATETIKDAKALNKENNAEFIQFIKDNDAYVKQANTFKTLSLLIMVGGYAASVVDALFDPFGSYKSASLVPESAGSYAAMGSQGESRSIETKWTFDLQLVPEHQNGLLASFNKSF